MTPKKCSNTSLLGGLPPDNFLGGLLLTVFSCSPIGLGRLRFRLVNCGIFFVARLVNISGELVRKFSHLVSDVRKSEVGTWPAEVWTQPIVALSG